MKALLFNSLLLLFAALTSAWAQSPMDGGWSLVSVNGQATDTELVAICQNGYFMFAQYRANGSFVSAGGGTYELDDDQYQMTYDFFTEDNTQVRVPQQYAAQLSGDRFTLQNPATGAQVWKRLPEETSPLQGAWRFATRVDEEGNEGERRAAGPRMTVKVLSGSRFQWAAFNYETKEFRGTGGGTYEAKDGRYTEHIAFFSRDNDRVGKSLSFQFDRKGDDWYHQGQSSTGEPLHEVWTEME